MATKKNPGTYDCYDKAEDDEPMFVLLARDPAAAVLVELWATLREQVSSVSHDGSEEEQIAEARQCAAAMRKWLRMFRVQKKPLVEAYDRIVQGDEFDVLIANTADVHDWYEHGRASFRDGLLRVRVADFEPGGDLYSSTVVTSDDAQSRHPTHRHLRPAGSI